LRAFETVDSEFVVAFNPLQCKGNYDATPNNMK